MWDNETTFSNLQTLAEGNSANVVDVGPDDIGLGEPVYLQVCLTGPAAGALTVKVETAAVATMSGARTLTQYSVEAARVARGGVVLAAPLPTGCGRYLRLAYSGASGGKITAGLVLGAQTACLA